MVIGENGLLKKASDSNAYSKLGAVKDEISMAYSSAFSEFMKETYTSESGTHRSVTELFNDELTPIKTSSEANIIYELPQGDITNGTITQVAVSVTLNGETYSSVGTLREDGPKSMFTWGEISEANTTEDEPVVTGSSPIIFKVKPDNEGYASIPIDEETTGIQVNWGDGDITTAKMDTDSYQSKNNLKLASLSSNNLKLAKTHYSMKHRYADSTKEYNVEITGNLKYVGYWLSEDRKYLLFFWK